MSRPDRNRHLGAAIAVAAVWLTGTPLRAQAALAGHWNPLYHEDLPERIPGPELGDYTGIPINDAARLRGDSYDANRISAVPEYQCRPHGADYSMRGLANLRIDDILDPVTQRPIGLRTRMGFQEMTRTIWLDGRERPSEHAPHTWQGFSLGEWHGNMLNVYTTHLKESYLRRNGLPRSASATFTEHWVRHGDHLTIATVITDPVFLTEPLVRTQTWEYAPNARINRDVCETVAEVPNADNRVPHYLPGRNPFLREFSEWYAVPYEGARGGAETLYPEFKQRMGPPPDNAPNVCIRFCTCGAGGALCLDPAPLGSPRTP
jgi:hypothetical protein